jgi:hypothetical protein
MRVREMNFTILGHKRVIRGAEVDEPTPPVELPQQQGGGVERGGQLGGPLRVTVATSPPCPPHVVKKE